MRADGDGDGRPVRKEYRKPGSHSMTNTTRRLICILAACSLGSGLLPGEGPEAADGPISAPAMFLRVFDYIDENHDGVVPLADFFRVLDLQQAEARQIKRIRKLDQDSDSLVTRAEAEAGVHAQVEYQVQRTLSTDANGDGMVSPREYALSYPDTSGETADADGLTPAQRRGFRRIDTDSDGRTTQAEVERVIGESYARWYWSQWMAARAQHLDRDGDGFLDESERDPLKAVEPDETEERIALRQVLYWFYRAKPADHSALEARFEGIEGPTLHANNPN